MKLHLLYKSNVPDSSESSGLTRLVVENGTLFQS
jgi:hypothetical protein